MSSLDDFKTIPNSDGIDINSVPSSEGIPLQDFSEGQSPDMERYTGESSGTGSIYDEGISYNEAMSDQGFAKRRHEEQPFFHSLGSALNQAVVGEVVGGTLEGLGYLLDIPQYAELVKGTEKEFSNGLSDIGKDIREWTQESTPIYTDPFKEGEFSPEDWTWWASNLPSVASTLSLMIPSGLAVKGLSMGAKAVMGANKLYKGINAARSAVGASKVGARVANWGAKGMSQAVISRHMENLMEGAGTMEGIVSELDGATVKQEQADAIRKNYGIELTPDEGGFYTIDETTAKEIGAKAASDIYKNNWAMLAQDIPQYMLLRTPFGKSTQELTAGVAKFLGKDAIKPMMKRTSAVLKDMVGEGMEEGYQYIIGERARENALVDAGLAERRDLGDAIKDYASRGEFATSAFFGALGAGAMQTGGKGISNSINRVKGIETIDESRINDLKQTGDRYRAFMTAKTLAKDTGNEALNDALDTHMVADMAVKYSQNGNLEPAIEIFEAQESMTPEESADLKLPENFSEAAKERNPELIKDFRRIGELYDQNVDLHGSDFAGMIAKEKFIAEKSKKKSSELNSIYNKSSNDWADNGMLSPEYKESFRIKNYEVPARETVVKALEEAKGIAEKSNDKDKANMLQTRIDKYKDEITELKAKSKESLSNRDSDVRNNDKIYEGRTIKVGRGKKRVPAVKSYIAPQSEESVDALSQALISDEMANNSTFEGSRLADPNHQSKLINKSKVVEKNNAEKNASEQGSSVAEVVEQSNQAKGTPVENVVESTHNAVAQQQMEDNVNDDDPREPESFDDFLNKAAPQKPVQIKAKPIEQEGAIISTTPEKSTDSNELKSLDEKLVDQFGDDVDIIKTKNINKIARLERSQFSTINAKEIVKKYDRIVSDHEALDDADMLQSEDESVKAIKTFENPNFRIGDVVLPKVDVMQGLVKEDDSHAIAKITKALKEIASSREDTVGYVDTIDTINSKDELSKFLISAGAYSAFSKNDGDVLPEVANMASDMMEYMTSLVTDINKSVDSKKKDNEIALSDKQAIDNRIDQSTPPELVESLHGDASLVKDKKGKHEYSISSKGKDRNSFWATDIIRDKSGDEYPVSTEIRRDLLNKGEIPIGTEIFFELDKKSQDYGMNIKNLRPIRLVTYIDGKRQVVGTLPTTGDVSDIRDSILANLDESKGSSGRFVKSKFKSKVDGVTVKFNRSKKANSPLSIVSDLDKAKNSDIGGIKLTYTNKAVGKTSWYVPTVEHGKEATRIPTNIPYAGQVGMIITDPFTGKEVPLIGFAKKMSSISKTKSDQIKEKALEVINKSDGTNDSKLARELKKIIILHKDDRSKPISFYKENKEAFNKAFNSSILNIDKNRMNNDMKSRNWELGFRSDKLEYYNEAISEFLEFNIGTDGYYTGTSLLVDQNLQETTEELGELEQLENEIAVLKINEESYNELSEVVIQKAIPKNGISKESIIKEIGVSKFGAKGDIPSYYIAKEGGSTIQDIAHSIMENYSDQLPNLDEQDIRNVIIDVIQKKVADFKNDILNIDKINEIERRINEISPKKPISKPIVNKTESEKIAEVAKPEVVEKKADEPTSGEEVKPTRKKRVKRSKGDISASDALIQESNRNKNDKRTKVASKDNYFQKWDKKTELAWVKNNLPGVTIGQWSDLKEIVKNGPELWGVFKDASIYISDNAGTGTAYHEAFHAVFNLYLSEKEAKGILSSYAKDNGLKQPQTEAESIAIEELIADEFSDYVLSGKNVKPKSWLKRVFDKLLKAIGIVKNSTVTEELFSKIDSGFYANAKVKPGIFGSNVVRNKPAEWTGAHAKDVAQAINQHMLLKVIPKIQEGDVTLKGFTSAQVLNELIKRGELRELYNIINDDFLALEDNYIDADLKEEAKVIGDILDNMFTESDEFGKAINESIRALDYYNGIKVSRKSAKEIYDDYQENENPDDGETSYKENWVNGATERSAKDNVPQQVKDYIRYLKIPNEKNLLGLDKYVEYSTTYDKLLLDTAGATDASEIADRIWAVYDSGLNKETGEYDGFNPEYYSIAMRLTNDKDMSTKFFNAFSKQHAIYTHIKQNKDNTFSIFEANKNGVTNRIINDWISGVSFDGEVLTTDNQGVESINTELATDLLLESNNVFSKQLSNVNESDIKKLSDIAMRFGIDLPKESIRYSIDTGNFYKFLADPLLKIYSAFTEGNNPFNFDGVSKEEITNEKKQIKYLANTVKYSKPSLYESSFRNIEDKTVYSHIVPNFLSILVHNLTKKDPKGTLSFYQQDRFYDSNPILNEISKSRGSNQELSNVFNVSILDGMSRKEGRSWHSKMSTQDRLTMSLALYYNNGSDSYAKYLGPVLSDAPNQLIFNMTKNSKSSSVDTLIDLAQSEYERMQIQGSNEKGEAIEFFDEVVPAYYMAPMFNGFKGAPRDNRDSARELINKWLETKSKEFFGELTKSKVIVFDESGNIDLNKSSLPSGTWTLGNILDNIKEFYINDYVMNSAFSTLTIGDPAFYKGKDNKSVDYYKRAKEIYSPKFIPDVTAEYDGVSAGTHYNSAYLYDNNIKAPSYDALKEALGNHPQARTILSHYNSYKDKNGKEVGKVNETDAQAYITLDFYKRSMISLGRWTERYEDAYLRLKDSKGTANDIALVMQPLKPFVYGHVYDEGREKIIPIQHKNSEYLLLPQMAEGNPVLQELYDKMNNEDFPIDVVNFESAVKVGASKKTTVGDLTTDNIHIIPMESRGIQMETPEHFLDSSNLFGTQIRKLIMAGLDHGVDYIVENGTEKPISNKAKDLHKLYEDIIMEDLKESFEDSKGEFIDKNGDLDVHKISELLIDEARSRGKSEDFEKSIEIDENGRFKLPLFHPLHSQTAQSLLNSIFRNRVTRQKIAGGAFIQASSFGLSEELKLVFDGNKLSYAEVLLPAWSAEFFKDFVDENGNLDFERAQAELPKEVFEMIGYRIPTEDKYSMLPLKVIGFTPLESGGAVMLPAEITTISGSDFDVDKMYIMMKEFKRTEKDGKILYKTTDYDYSKDASKNNKKSRNNAKIDIIRSVLMNPSTLSSIFNPGGYAKLKEEASSMVRDASGEETTDLEMFSHMKRVSVANDNMAGKAMVGIAANHNAHHALRLWSDLALVDGIRFNGSIGTSLNGDTPIEQYSYNEEDKLANITNDGITLTITKNLAEFLAAVVDNAKDPVAASINYNEVTADTYSLIISTGFDTLTATAFMSQPIIKKLVDVVKGGKTIEEAFSVLKESEGLNINLSNSKASDLSTKDLYNNLSSTNNNFQAKVLETFKVYSKQAKVLGKLISASKADTKGLEASLASGEIVQESIQDLLVNDNKVISGMESFLTGTKDTNHVRMFTEFGIDKPMDILQKLFPYNDDLFSKIKSNISTMLVGGRRLNEKQRNVINDHIVNYYMSQYDYFDPNDRNYFVEDFPMDFFDYVKSNPELKSNRFIKSLQFTPSDKYTPLNRIASNNTGGMTIEGKTDINNGFKDLFASKHKPFVDKLVKYAYFTSGLGFGAKGFAHYIPTDIYLKYIKDSSNLSISDYLYNITNLNGTNDVVFEFTDQFMRNMAENVAYVPRMNENNKYSDGDNGEIYVRGEANPNVVVEEIRDKGVVVDYDMARFISMDLDGVVKLFILDESYMGDSFKYIETSRLGVKNVSLQYLMNGGPNLKAASDITVDEDISENLPQSEDDIEATTMSEFKSKITKKSSTDINNSTTKQANEAKKKCKK